MSKPYIVYGGNGNPTNGKYPPDREKYGEEFCGYRSEAEKVLFHDFAVLSSDFYIFYNDTFYSVNKEADSIKVSWNAFLSDSKVVYNEEEYHDEMGFLENFKIDGKLLMNIIDNNESIKITKKVVKSYIGYDDNGYPYNCKYPPNKEKYGDLFEGYKNKAEGVLFYDFGVQNYDVSFKYKGKDYYLLTEPDHVAVCDEHFTEEYEIYTDAMDLIENFKIDGRPLIDMMDEIEEIDPE